MFDIEENTENYNSNQILTTNGAFREQLRHLETNELEQVLSGSEEYHYLEKVDISCGREAQVEYRALASMGTFTQKTPGAQFLYCNKEPLAVTRTTSAASSLTNAALTRMEYGYETALRTLNPPQVRETCTKFEELRSKLSPRAQRLLRRTNFRGRKYIHHDQTSDRFYRKKFPSRVMDMVYAILHFSLLRRDYAQAYKVLSLLLRRPNFDTRTMLGVASELLAWNSRKKTGLTAPMKLAQWAGNAYRLLPLNASLMRHGRVVDPNWSKVWLLPAFLAFTTRRYQGAQAALGAIQLELSTPPSNQLALNYGICGSLALEVGDLQLAASSFSRCLQLGGFLPLVYIKFLNRLGYKQPGNSGDPLGLTYTGDCDKRGVDTANELMNEEISMQELDEDPKQPYMGLESDNSGAEMSQDETSDQFVASNGQSPIIELETGSKAGLATDLETDIETKLESDDDDELKQESMS